MKLRTGDRLVATLEGGDLVMRQTDRLDQELWARYAHLKGDLVEELSKERRAIASQEAKE